MNRRWTVSQLLARPLPVAIRGSGRRQGLGCTPLGQLVELEELEEIAADLKPTELFDLFNVAKNARQQIVSNGQNPEMYSATWIGKIGRAHV